MPLSFKRCTKEDIDVLLDISRETFTDTYATQNNPEDFKAYMEEFFARDRLIQELGSEAILFYLAYANGKPAGYFKLNRAGAQTDINEPGSLELERIYLLKTYQGRELGRDLIQKAIEICRDQKASYLWLGVWDQNARAIRFYEKNGFVKFGEHPFFIGRDKQNDWLMKIDF
ncbi:GNAT family N-acetyltransferase [Sinomicrobium sp. FJxs]|uniref:GNAT family N-acetyltransferase n=2 Tax=Sinomicrobium weinanense TaxID=2842200 RepID=A0A926Q3Y2_9FLAO|nr:GNAT family N-acetyltransferase [Sinomicrobium weinanense]MBU3124864.1 GNAT family N-acetyltransferase [Sinomicrobium weinanense]